MHAPYRPLHTMPKVPDMPVDKPELSDEAWERNNRNIMRLDAIAAIDTLVSNMMELSDDNGLGFQNTIKDLSELRDSLERDMEE